MIGKEDIKYLHFSLKGNCHILHISFGAHYKEEWRWWWWWRGRKMKSSLSIRFHYKDSFNNRIDELLPKHIEFRGLKMVFNS